jgi:hypothetical protein
MYFHGLYVQETATLHLHIRVNQGILDYENNCSFSIDELIQQLLSGNKIKDLMLDRLQKNPDSAFHSDCIDGFTGFLVDEEGRQLIPGVNCLRDVENPYHLRPRSQENLSPSYIHTCMEYDTGSANVEQTQNAQI